MDKNPLLMACDLMQGGVRWFQSSTPPSEKKRAWGQVVWAPNPYTTAAQDVFGTSISATHENAWRYNAMGAIERACDGYSSWKFQPALQSLMLAINPSLTVEGTNNMCQDLLVTAITEWNNGDDMSYAMVRQTMHRAAGLYEEIKGQRLA